MFKNTHTNYAPWLIIKGHVREECRIQGMRYVLSLFDYDRRSNELKPPDCKQLKAFS